MLTRPTRSRRRQNNSAERRGITRGKIIRLSPQRRFVCDLVRYAKTVPSIPMQRIMQLADVVAARRDLSERPSWSSIFLKAYCLVSAENPELRRAYISFPWPRMYEHPHNIASFSFERIYNGEEGVFFAQIPRPELRSLAELDAMIRHYKTAPVDSVQSFRRAMFISRLPAPLRRFAWWWGLNVDGLRRAKVFGTFGITIVASLGAAGLHILTPLSTALNYGTFTPDGSLDVRLTYDHRVMDGANVARYLAALEETLHGEILAELRSGATPQTAPDVLAFPQPSIMRQNAAS